MKSEDIQKAAELNDERLQLDARIDDLIAIRDKGKATHFSVSFYVDRGDKYQSIVELTGGSTTCPINAITMLDAIVDGMLDARGELANDLRELGVELMPKIDAKQGRHAIAAE